MCKFRWRRLVFLSLFAAAMTGTGCTSTFTADRAARLPAISAEAKAPLRLGLYMQPQVREHTTRFSTLRLKPGGSLAKGVEAMMRSVFSNVFLLGSLSSARAADLDAVLVVDVLGSDFHGGYGGNVYSILVQYTVMDSEERILWSESISGTGKRSFAANLLKRVYPDCMRLAIEDNLEKTLNAMQASQWWQPLIDDSDATSE